jgi:hypothetical protein
MTSLRIVRGLALCGGSRRCAYIALGGIVAKYVNIDKQK